MTHCNSTAPKGAKEDSLEELQRNLEIAVEQLANAKQEASFARNRETECLNRVNAIQKKIDAAIEALREGAPSESDWIRSRQRGLPV